MPMRQTFGLVHLSAFKHIDHIEHPLVARDVSIRLRSPHFAKELDCIRCAFSIYPSTADIVLQLECHSISTKN